MLRICNTSALVKIAEAPTCLLASSVRLVLLVCVQVGLHLGKATSRYASQLKVVAPKHPMVLRAAAGEGAFDRAAAAVA